ncbi:MFS general substrate transporter [Phellopilus nigrolimitatus]|nr:MFS general substrate transporter [Phellopilus nigrolimitatus]
MSRHRVNLWHKYNDCDSSQTFLFVPLQMGTSEKTAMSVDIERTSTPRSVIESQGHDHGMVDTDTGKNEDGNISSPVGAAGEEDTDVVYPSGLTLALLTTGLALVIFVVALDNTIIATAIPTITSVFDSLDDVGWYGSAYLLTTTSLQPSFGKIYSYFDVKWTYLSALVVFEVGSVICASATSSPMLIIGRAVAGAGASALFQGGLTIVGFSVPLRKMPIYIAVLSSMFGIASVVGPILGGALTDRASWRWCFWINLPFGGVAFTTVFFFFKPPKRRLVNLTLMQKIKKIDILGAVFLICAIVCLLLALQWGGTTHPFKSPKIWGLLLGFALMVLVFIGIQFYRGDDATVPPRIFIRQRTVCTASIFACLLSMGLYTHVYYLPFYFQAVKGTSAEGSGIRSIPYLVSITISSLICGILITKVGWYVPFVWAGAALFTVGAGLLFTLKVSSSAGTWIGYQLVTGFGAGAGLQVPFLAVQAVLNAQDMPSGNAVVMFFNSLGGAVSISVAQNIFSNTLVEEIPKQTTGLNPAVIVAAGATHLREVVPASQLQGVLVAYTYALDQAFILPIAAGATAFVVSLFMEWKTVKGKKIVHGAVG